MQDFLRCLNKNDAIITLDGQDILKKDITLLGSGAEKNVYGINQKDICFMLTHLTQDSNASLQAEKTLCDEILSLGIKAQNYQYKPICVRRESGGPTFKANALVMKKFENLAQDESLTIYHSKALTQEQKITGKKIEFYNGEIENFNSPEWNRQILRKIINEYVVALTFKLPILQNQRLDDSVHICFEHSEGLQAPPVARYLFWDVASDFSGLSLPIVPALNDLKDGMDHHRNRLRMLANQVASTMLECNFDEMKKFGIMSKLSCQQIEDRLFSSISEDMLNAAIVHARQVASENLQAKLRSRIAKGGLPLPEKDAMYPDFFNAIRNILLSAISTENPQCIDNALELVNNTNLFSENFGENLQTAAKTYNEQAFFDLLEQKLKVPKKSSTPKPITPTPTIATEPEAIMTTKAPPPHSIAHAVALRAILFASLGTGLLCLDVLPVPTVMTACTVGFMGSTLWEGLRMLQAKIQYFNAFRNRELTVENHRVTLAPTSTLDKNYFYDGVDAENTWTGYFHACLSPMTYLPYSKASNSFQMGRETARVHIEDAPMRPKL